MLEGLRVLSFTHYVQGPAATQYLADMGADVVKIEPLDGAWERRRMLGGAYHGASATYVACNRNKRSLAIDLKHARAAEVVHALVGWCDVLAENYRHGVLDRLGFGYDTLRARNPGLIYASATGWGAQGPLRDRPGQDLLVQARTGMVATTGPHDAPTAGGAILVDQHGAALFAMGILGAYARKLRTGEGSRVEASLLTAALDLQMESISLWFAMGARREALARPQQLATWLHDAPYGVYRLADALAVISLGPNADRLAAALGGPLGERLGGLDRRGQRDLYVTALAEGLASWTWDELDAALGPQGLWYERVAPDYDAVRDDPQVQAAGAISQVPAGERDLTVLNHPVRYDGVVPGLRDVAWTAGAHTRAVLRDAGFTEDDVDDLLASGVVAADDR